MVVVIVVFRRRRRLIVVEMNRRACTKWRYFHNKIIWFLTFLSLALSFSLSHSLYRTQILDYNKKTLEIKQRLAINMHIHIFAFIFALVFTFVEIKWKNNQICSCSLLLNHQSQRPENISFEWSVSRALLTKLHEFIENLNNSEKESRINTSRKRHKKSRKSKKSKKKQKKTEKS